MKIPYTITNNSVTLVRNGLPVTVLREHPSFDFIIDAIKESNWEKVIEALDQKTTVKVITEGEAEEREGRLFVKLDNGSWWQAPIDLGKHIVDFYYQKLPYQPWILFAKKLQQNPSYRSVQELFQFLNANNFTLSDDGDFIAYKRVKSDFKDIHSGTFDNSVGTVVTMPRNEVDEDSDRTCSNGLHVAAFDYACNHFGSSDSVSDKLVYVSVNPKDVVAVPKDYNNQKMRVCEYKVLGVCDFEFKERCYSSDYGFYGSKDLDTDEYEEWGDGDCEECHCEDCYCDGDEDYILD